MDGHRLTELLYACTGKRLDRPRDTRIVHYNIDPSKLLSDTFEHRINPRLICNIYSWENAKPASRTRRRNYLLQNARSLIQRFLPPPHYDNIGAIFGKLPGDCLSYTSSAASNNYGPIFKS